MTEDEMVGWHHQLDGHEFEQTLGDGEGQASMGSQRVEHNQATEQQQKEKKMMKNLFKLYTHHSHKF